MRHATLLTLLALGCHSRPAPGPPPPAAPSVRVMPGPWEGGAAIAMVATGPRSLEGAWNGPVILMVSWARDGVLETSSSFDNGRGWSKPFTVHSPVDLGDGGQIRPMMALGRDGPVIAFAADGVPMMATRGAEGWSAIPVAPDAQGALVAAGQADGEAVIAWLDTRRGAADVWARVGDVVGPVFVDDDDGVCACCRPAVGEVDGLPAVAFRDAEGPLREARLAVFDGAWQDRGRVTTGGWSPGGCPTDGPVFDGPDVLISDARDGTRRLYRGDAPVPTTEGWGATQPRVAGGSLVRIETSPERSRVVIDDLPLIGSETTLELGDPIEVPGAVLVPWDSDGSGYVAVVSAPEGVP
ncbi:MAG: hypothetical protein H6739_03170 [Alphaproteobacteria bacterium]|nr:hypothetical protein [Alphaproteobacteria bacterium]